MTSVTWVMGNGSRPCSPRVACCPALSPCTLLSPFGSEAGGLPGDGFGWYAGCVGAPGSKGQSLIMISSGDPGEDKEALAAGLAQGERLIGPSPASATGFCVVLAHSYLIAWIGLALFLPI